MNHSGIKNGQIINDLLKPEIIKLQFSLNVFTRKGYFMYLRINSYGFKYLNYIC